MNFFFYQQPKERTNERIAGANSVGDNRIFRNVMKENVNSTVVIQRNTPTPQNGVVMSLAGTPTTLSQTSPIFRQFPIYRVPPSIPPPISHTPVEPPKQEAKMTWGEPTWFLFHTLAEKVIESHFLDIRIGLLDIIYSICLNLPCPKCAEHAKGHLNGINFNTIRTKEDLKMLLFDFHNLVNSRKGYDIFKYDNLKKYEVAITKAIIHNFLIEYNKKSKNIRYLADDLHRERMASSLKKWFSENLVHFHE
jgi:hypothetical protein